MVKKLQSLKAKKGFTLVELIVVIAIIAVLAAILVPTMLGYVTSSRVTSADSTAASLKDTVGNAMVETDTKGETVPRSGSVSVSFSVDGAGKVTSVTVGDGTSFTKLQDAIKDKINDDYNFTKTWSAQVFIKDGKVVGCAYSSTGASLSSFTEGEFTGGTTSKWDTKTDGIMGNEIIGTSPKLIKS